MQPRQFQDIIFEKDDQTGIVMVTLNRPEIKNALTIRVVLELRWAVEAVSRDDGAKAMIITGAKPTNSDAPAKEAFCSGWYLNPADIEALDEETKKELDLADIAQKKLCLMLWNLNKPVIAAINGLAIGGGFTIPLAGADLIYLSEHAWVRLPFTSLAIAPELASSFLVPRLMGFQKAKEIFFFGEKLPASDLLALGLVNKVLPHDELIPYSKNAALKLIPPAGAGLAVSRCKEILHKPFTEAVTRALDLENEALLKATQTADFGEALTALIEKRAPVFKGE